ncbi:MAG: S8 family serine peptidase [Bdellovibrionales bacterium]
MKLRRVHLSVAIGVMIAAVLFQFNNCSKGFKSYSSIDELSNEGVIPPIIVPGGKKMELKQDIAFRFAIPNAQTGATYQASGLPSWIQIDNAKGEIFGVPPKAEKISNVRVSVTLNGETKTAGPYEIEVTGDPLRQYLWHLYNTAQTNFAAGPGRAGEDLHLQATIASGIAGEGIKVAISDSGVVESHKALKANLLPGASRNYLQDFVDLNSWIGDSTPDQTVPGNAHGTGVAGLVAEPGWDGIGGRGVAPKAKFAGFLFIPAQDKLAANNLYTIGSLDQLRGDFDVFNYSWGFPQCGIWEIEEVYREAARNGAKTQRNGKGSLFIRAAGNDYVGDLADCFDNLPPDLVDTTYLGNSGFSEENTSPETLVVGALTALGSVAQYSSPGANLWISAPGGEFGLNADPPGTSADASEAWGIKRPAITSTDFPGCTKGLKTLSGGLNLFDLGEPPNEECLHMATFNGTSAAAPIASGAVALLLSLKPELTWRDVKHILALTADQLTPTLPPTGHPLGADLAGHDYESAWITNAAGRHFHNWYGFGRINVDKAVAMARTYASTLGTFKETNVNGTWTYDSGPLNLNVPPGAAAGISRSIAVTEALNIEAVQVRVAAVDCIGNLGIEVTSPSGTTSIIQNINSFVLDPEIYSHIYLSNAFYGESSAGNWSLKLIGGDPTCTTKWTDWQINIMGH